MKINNNKIKSLFLLSLVGSGLAKEENSKNQSEITYPSGINFNSLPKLAVNHTEEGNNPNQTLLFAGMPIFFRDQIVGDQGLCVTSFAVVSAGYQRECTWTGSSGFLTSARCCKNNNGCGMYATSGGGASAFLVADNPQKIGIVGDTAFSDNEYPRTDFGFVIPDDTFHLVPYVIGDQNLLPVTGLGSVTLGTNVCAYGPISGYLCGKVVDMELSRWTDTGLGPIFFKDLNKVDLGEYGFEDDNDLGGPVYIVSNIGEHTIAQALGYITKVDNSDQYHKFLYYTPLDKALEALVAVDNCYHTLMTYNETSTEQLQAQVEIPPKK